MQPISNAKLTLLRKLLQKKYRLKEKLFLVEGERAVEQVIENDKLELQYLFFDESQHTHEQPYWKEAAERFGSYLVDENAFREVTDTDNPQGVLALCTLPAETPVEEMTQRNGLIVASDGIQDPGNLGTIIRTAAWFGVQGLVFGKGTVDPFHPKVVRATAGATGSLAYCQTELVESLPHFEGAGWQVILLDGSNRAQTLREVKVEAGGQTLIVIGNEAHGVNETLFSNQRLRAGIPSAPGESSVESLNAGIAAAIAMYVLSPQQ